MAERTSFQPFFFSWMERIHKTDRLLRRAAAEQRLFCLNRHTQDDLPAGLRSDVKGTGLHFGKFQVELSVNIDSEGYYL